MQPKLESYHLTVHPTATVAAAFAALTTHVDQWWGPVNRPLRAKGDRYTISFEKTRWTFAAIEFDPGHRLVLHCVDAHHVHAGLPDSIREEWKGTRLIWTLTPSDNGCTVHFEHVGLQPTLRCFEICQQGWNHYLGKSLLQFLDYGRGSPS